MWAFGHSPTCNNEQGENTSKNNILVQTGECEAENKVAKKSSACKPIMFTCLFCIYLYFELHCGLRTFLFYQVSAVAALLCLTGFIATVPCRGLPYANKRFVSFSD